MKLATVLLTLRSPSGSPGAGAKPSDSYLALRIDGPRIEGQWDIALRDLDFAVGLDANADGEITWGELRARHAESRRMRWRGWRFARRGAAGPRHRASGRRP